MILWILYTDKYASRISEEQAFIWNLISLYEYFTQSINQSINESINVLVSRSSLTERNLSSHPQESGSCNGASCATSKDDPEEARTSLNGSLRSNGSLCSLDHLQTSLDPLPSSLDPLPVSPADSLIDDDYIASLPTDGRRSTQGIPEVNEYTINNRFMTEDSARLSFFTLFSRFYTLTSGNKMTAEYVTVDQFSFSRY